MADVPAESGHNPLPPGLEEIAAGDLAEAKRVLNALKTRIARRDLAENPAAIANMILQLRNGGK